MGIVKKRFFDAQDWHYPTEGLYGRCGICYYGGGQHMGKHRYNDIQERLEFQASGLDRAIEFMVYLEREKRFLKAKAVKDVKRD